MNKFIAGISSLLMHIALGVCVFAATPRQDEIASIHVSVTSVRPWAEYEDALQPKFELSAAAALERVGAATRQIDERVFDGLGFALEVAYPGTATTNASALLNDPQIKGGKASAIPSAMSVLTNPVPVHASLQYLAATALYQEVQLINRAFRDAVALEGYEPYVVRLQVTVIPRKRDAGYDVTSDLSFFLGPPPFDTSAKSPDGIVRVMPMLATDSIESALHGNSEERLRSLSLAIAAMLPQVSIGANFEKIRDALTSMLGRDYNSTFTIARLTDNTVRCRFGAIAQTATKFSLVPQNHFVTLLVFVPKTVADGDKGRERVVRAIADNQLIDVKTGKLLPIPQNRDFFKDAFKYLKENNIKFTNPGPDQYAKLGKVAQAVAVGDRTGFDKLVRRMFTQRVFGKQSRGVIFPDAFWADIAGIWGRSSYSLAQFELPKAPDSNEKKVATWKSAFATALAIDDGEVTTVELRGFPRLRRELLMARLESAPGHWSDQILAGPGTFDELTQVMTYRFPSLAADKENTLPAGTRLHLKLVPSVWERPTKAAVTDWGDLALNYLAVKKAKVEPPAGFKLVSSAKTIVMDEKGVGSVRFLVSPQTKGTKVTAKGTIEGGSIIGIDPRDPKLAEQKAFSWEAKDVADDLVVTLQLEGLNPDQEVIIGASNKTNEGKADPVKFKVIFPKTK
jgi:hypothetical protein